MLEDLAEALRRTDRRRPLRPPAARAALPRACFACWPAAGPGSSSRRRIASATHRGARDLLPLAQAFIDANADQVVWGSDWPHTELAGAPPSDASLVDELAAWLPDAAIARRICAANPARLYDFGDDDDDEPSAARRDRRHRDAGRRRLRARPGAPARALPCAARHRLRRDQPARHHRRGDLVQRRAAAGRDARGRRRRPAARSLPGRHRRAGARRHACA